MDPQKTVSRGLLDIPRHGRCPVRGGPGFFSSRDKVRKPLPSSLYDGTLDFVNNFWDLRQRGKREEDTLRERERVDRRREKGL